MKMPWGPVVAKPRLDSGPDTERLEAINALQPVDIKEIRTLIDLMKKNGLAVFKMEREDFKITLKTADAGAARAPDAPLPAVAAEPAAAAPAFAAAPEIVSPMVGTFYASSSPDAGPFVEEGSVVTPETVVCIIEAMKVMNEIKAEVGGTIAEVCAENGKPVQFGQPLFRVK